LADHQASRWIAEPCIRLFDCCQETDGSVALVITAADRARHTRDPIVIETAAGAALFEQEVASDHYRSDLSVMDGTVALARQLFEASGISRSDIDVALVYDAFTPILLMQLEALGFCGYGEAKDFIGEGNLGPKGTLPCNTNGGLIGEGYIHGMNLTLEAVRQLRGDAANQLDNPQLALISASRTGTILRRP
jgi:acetyl-CoA acetyltransferase